MTDPLRYITEIPSSYQPYIYQPRRTLVKFLRDKHIINKSNYNPSAEEIEILALDTGFIPPHTPNEEKDILQRRLLDYFHRVDRLIHFAINPTNIIRGHVGHLLNEPWLAPTTDWAEDHNIQSTIHELDTAIHPRPIEPLPDPLQSAWDSLRTNTSIYVLKADKGGATVIWDRNEYKAEALRQLSDTNTYELIADDQIDHTLATLDDLKSRWLGNLQWFEHISKREQSLIKQSNSAIPAIYFLPKVHKALNPVSGTFPGRPIVATFDCHLHWLDKYITIITNDLHHRIPHSLVDTLDLLRKLNDFEVPLPQTLRLFSADVSNLYPSIRWTPGVAAATEVYSTFHSYLVDLAKARNKRLPPNPPLFAALLQSILENSYMHFQSKNVYHQKKGTAMGMCISVYFAKCYMYKMISTIISNPPSHLLCLEIFIDDLYVMSTGSDSEIFDLIKAISNDDIAYTYDPPGTATNMLDLTISITNGRLSTKPYSKPTSAPFYLHASSMHAKPMIKSIPYAQLLRLRRNSSYTDDFLTSARKLMRTLKLRGYSNDILNKALDATLGIPQMILIMDQKKRSAPQRQTFEARPSVKLILPFSNSLDRHQARSALKNFHEALILYFQQLDIVPNPFTQRTSEIVFSNLRTLGTKFTAPYKKGQ